MRTFNIIPTLALSWVATASAPTYDGFDVVWEDSFEGSAGSLPDTSKWIMQDWYKNLNGDWQTYTTSPANQQLTGDGSLLIIPRRDSSATKGWTSGRLESAYTFTPAPGERTIAEASLRLGNAPASGKQGIWPAFWLLGDSHRKGTLIWPTCGEIDIMENVNGETKTQGVIHCDKNPGGICNEKNGIAGATGLPDAGEGFHTYTTIIDRTPGNWKEESVSFYLDGTQYHQVTGDRIGDEQVWGKIAHNLIHFILNVAVGGEWPGDPNESTLDGLDNAMEVKYVAHYESTGSGRVPKYQDIESGQSDYGYGHVSEPKFPQSPPRIPHSTRPHPSPDYFDFPPPSSPHDGDLPIYDVPGRPGVYSIPDVPFLREVRPGIYETDGMTYSIPELPGLRKIPGSPGLYRISRSHDNHSYPGYSDPHELPTYHNFPAPGRPPRGPDYETSPFPSRPRPEPRPAPVPGRMTDTDRQNHPSPMYPTRGRYGSSQQTHEFPNHSQGGFTEAASHYPHNDSQGHGAQCPAPSAGSPYHGTYGRPGGWGPGTGKGCSDSVAPNKLKARHISSPDYKEEIESEIDSESSKPRMPYRFKTPGYPPAPGPNAIAPPTVAQGEFGGVQAKDKSKYLDRSNAARDMSYRFKTPGYPPALAPDAVAPPTVTPGEFGGVQPGVGGGCLDRKNIARDMPPRFKTPGFPPLPAPDAVAPPTVAPGEFGGVQAKDNGKYPDPRGVNGTTPVSGQGTPRYGVSKEGSMMAMVFAVVALLILY
ncbi:hypothetical protein FVEN_g4954 [Fusarium venenatum]|uniref:GH16 domain-containing protein n=1 Tax=Fusarium venenatum TaxID=56646 RepID=A0A2L2SX33_9HYPO|nr:uncharacterized protein FVRRES_06848 [Fusarium venenatum]KAG8357027.1 hypothetical protein FVEN_g4954 [Fusarium venenatum]KAH6993810.1 concanavalin A-like lectin/glucanase domain-containing protein [Fusarium venenatum]CEI62412.1 unnamed protein product [Fusarium venenatum]